MNLLEKFIPDNMVFNINLTTIAIISTLLNQSIKNYSCNTSPPAFSKTNPLSMLWALQLTVVCTAVLGKSPLSNKPSLNKASKLG